MEMRSRSQMNVNAHPKIVDIQTAHCPEGCDLMCDEVKIRDMKSIRVQVRWNNQEGLIYLDPEFGSYDHISQIKIPTGEVVEFFCPECGASLQNEENTCSSCSSPTFRFDLPGEGQITGCLKKGCFEHTLKIESFESMQMEIDEGFVRVIM